ncbi:siderophore-interacting protein [Breoghania sp. L-A4]|nr:siderophore-interacting protein [Breoghania sp. L-A4]
MTVAVIDRLSPTMLRVEFTCDDFADFVSPAHDDHIKLFFPGPGGPETGKPLMRDFTPRRFDVAAGMITIDFAIHEEGPATDWATSARPGDTLEIGGPRGSTIVPDDFDWYLLIGDETALPAITRRVEELRDGVPVTSFVVVADPTDAQSVETRAAWTPHWLVRTRPDADASMLRTALDAHELPSGDGFVWIAAEGTVAKAIRGYIVEERGHPRQWVKASGYWSRGEVNAKVKIED